MDRLEREAIALFEQSTRDDALGQAAWRLAREGTLALAVEAPRYADRVLWPRVTWTLDFAIGAITASAAAAAPAERAAMRSTLQELAALATRADHGRDAAALQRLVDELAQ